MSESATSSVNILFGGVAQHSESAFPSKIMARLDGSAKLLPGLLSTDWREEAPPASLAEAEVVLGTWGMPRLDEELLAAMPKLRAVLYAAGSVKSFATNASFARGVKISSAWAANGIPVAEYTLSTILLSLKRFWAYQRESREQQAWQREIPVTGAFGATVGIVSLGAIGRYLVDLLKNFDLRVIAYDPFIKPEEAERLGVEAVSLDAVFEQSDVVTLHTPWLPETEGLVNARLLEKLKPNATLINTSRGAIVNERDLVSLLSVRGDVTAILDVTYPEPPEPKGPLFQLPNLIITPHIAGSMGNEVARMGSWMVDEYLRLLAGEPLHHEVTRESLARMA